MLKWAAHVRTILFVPPLSDPPNNSKMASANTVSPQVACAPYQTHFHVHPTLTSLFAVHSHVCVFSANDVATRSTTSWDACAPSSVSTSSPTDAGSTSLCNDFDWNSAAGCPTSVGRSPSRTWSPWASISLHPSNAAASSPHIAWDLAWHRSWRFHLAPTHPCGARWMCGLRASTPTDKRECASVDSLKCMFGLAVTWVVSCSKQGLKGNKWSDTLIVWLERTVNGQDLTEPRFVLWLLRLHMFLKTLWLMRSCPQKVCSVPVSHAFWCDFCGFQG